jgi:hypothetical protein
MKCCELRRDEVVGQGSSGDKVDVGGDLVGIEQSWQELI